MTRLIRLEALSQVQIRALNDIHGSYGTCTCGHIFTATSPKFILGNFVTKHPTDKNLKECVVMAAYCTGCFTRINNTLKSIALKGTPNA